jgi:perosamine synthetase
MFKSKDSWGEHSTWLFDKEVYKFRQYMEELFETNDIEHLHLAHSDFIGIDNVDTPLHKKFYQSIYASQKFKDIYCNFIRQIQLQFFNEDEYLIYQSFPSVRFQFPGSIALAKHCDSDHYGSHPLGERNFIIPLTKMSGSATLFVESSPGKEDYKGQELEYGDLFFFNGNTCVHYSEPNNEEYVRISLDFRVIRPGDYMKYILHENIIDTRPRQANSDRKPISLKIGGYYQIVNKSRPDWEHFCLKDKIVQSRPKFGEEEARALSEYTSGDVFYTEFRETTKLENFIKQKMNVKYCSMVTSGTAAIICALLGCNIKAGDEVILPAYTMIATLNAVKIVGATPTIIDVNRDTATIDLEHVKMAVTPNTKAVIHVSLNNRDSGLKEISSYCRENSIFLIEDAAQSVGCSPYGTVGDVGCFSLSTPKIISTGQGGFVVTNNEDIAKNVHMIKNFGRISGGVEKYETFGLNFKFTDLQAVVGLEQFKKLDDRVNRYKEIALEYNKYIQIEKFTSFPWFVDYYTKERSSLKEFLNKHGVETRECYPCLSDLPNSRYISENGLFLPTHMELTNCHIKYISLLILFFKEYIC